MSNPNDATQPPGTLPAEPMALLWRLCDDGALPAEAGSLLLGELAETRPTP
jgi:hypothetical protein